MNDKPHPYTTVVELFRSLEHAKSHEERMEIVKMARHIRLKLMEEEPLRQPEPLELSVLAKRIHKHCVGMRMTGQAAARNTKMVYSGRIRAAIKELIQASLARRAKKNLYEFIAAAKVQADSLPIPTSEKQKQKI